MRTTEAVVEKLSVGCWNMAAGIFFGLGTRASVMVVDGVWLHVSVFSELRIYTFFFYY